MKWMLSNLSKRKARRMCDEKSAFLTKDEAKRAAHHAIKTNGRKLGLYSCPLCHCYHLTSIKGVS